MIELKDEFSIQLRSEIMKIATKYDWVERVEDHNPIIGGKEFAPVLSLKRRLKHDYIPDFSIYITEVPSLQVKKLPIIGQMVIYKIKTGYLVVAKDSRFSGWTEWFPNGLTQRFAKGLASCFGYYPLFEERYNDFLRNMTTRFLIDKLTHVWVHVKDEDRSIEMARWSMKNFLERVQEK
jgi:hypothetical protein